MKQQLQMYVAIDFNRPTEFTSQDEAIEHGYTLDPSDLAVGNTTARLNDQFTYSEGVLSTYSEVTEILVKLKGSIELAPDDFREAIMFLIAAQIASIRERTQEANRLYKRYRSKFNAALLRKNQPQLGVEQIAANWRYRISTIRGSG